MNALESTRVDSLPLHCQGSDCALISQAADWFGDVPSSEELEDSNRDLYGDRV